MSSDAERMSAARGGPTSERRYEFRNRSAGQGRVSPKITIRKEDKAA